MRSCEVNALRKIFAQKSEKKFFEIGKKHFQVGISREPEISVKDLKKFEKN